MVYAWPCMYKNLCLTSFLRETSCSPRRSSVETVVTILLIVILMSIQCDRVYRMCAPGQSVFGDGSDISFASFLLFLSPELSSGQRVPC